MKRPHGTLLILWSVTIATFLLAALLFPNLIPTPNPPKADPIAALMAGGSMFGAFGLAILTYRRTATTPHELVRPRLYRAVFASIIAMAATAAVAGGSAIIVDPHTGDRDLQLVLFASSNVVVAIVSWRAIVRPLPRRAALAAVLATWLPVLASLGDLLIVRSSMVETVAARIALFTSSMMMVAGMFGCMIALALFRPSALPEARTVA